MRKTIGLKLRALDDDLFAGKFHDKSDTTKSGLKINKDRFFQTVAPLVYELTGTKDDCEGDPGLPGRTLAMVKDIMRKKFRHYTLKEAALKKAAALKKTENNETPSSVKVGAGKPTKRPTKRKLEPEIRFGKCTTNDVREFFQFDDVDDVSYKCLKCKSH